MVKFFIPDCFLQAVGKGAHILLHAFQFEWRSSPFGAFSNSFSNSCDFRRMKYEVSVLSTGRHFFCYTVDQPGFKTSSFL